MSINGHLTVSAQAGVKRRIEALSAKFDLGGKQ